MKRFINLLLIMIIGLCIFGCSKNEESDKPAGDKPEDNPAEEKWLCIKETYYVLDGQVESYVINKYDDDGRFLSFEEYDADNNLLNTGKTIYDEKGREVEYLYYDEKGELQMRCVNEYDDKDQLIKATDYDSDGKVTDYYIYEYDANGNNIHHENTTEDGNLSMSTDSEYDDKGRIIRVHYDFYGYGEWTIEYAYNGDNIDKVTRYNSDGTIFSVTLYKYNESTPDLTEAIENYDGNNNLQHRYEYRYDENGNEISYAMFDAKGNMVTMCEYEYKKK